MMLKMLLEISGAVRQHFSLSERALPHTHTALPTRQATSIVTFEMSSKRNTSLRAIQMF